MKDKFPTEFYKEKNIIKKIKSNIHNYSNNYGTITIKDLSDIIDILIDEINIIYTIIIHKKNAYL
jgi:hypothetical protein